MPLFECVKYNTSSHLFYQKILQIGGTSDQAKNMLNLNQIMKFNTLKGQRIHVLHFRYRPFRYSCTWFRKLQTYIYMYMEKGIKKLDIFGRMTCNADHYRRRYELIKFVGHSLYLAEMAIKEKTIDSRHIADQLLQIDDFLLRICHSGQH